MRLLVEESRDLPIVQLVLVARAGSASDPAGKEGLANMATELLLRGAGGRDRAAIDEAIDRLGASLTVDTEPDYVRLVGRVLARNLDPFLDLTADVLLRADLPEPELERLKVELHADLDDLRDDDHSLVARYHARAVYATSPYGRSGDGTHDSIDRIDRADCATLASRELQPKVLLAGVAGALDHDGARDRLRARLGVDAFTAPTAGASPSGPRPTGRRLTLVDKPDRTQVQLLLGHVALPVNHPDALALQVGLTAFGGMFSSPLMQEVRVKRGWSYGAGIWLEPRRGPGAVTLHLFPANEQAPDALRLVLDLFENLAKNGVAATLVDRAREHLIHSLAMDLETPEKRIARRLAIDLFGLPADYLEHYRERVAAISADRAHAALTSHLRPADLIVTAVATASRSLDALVAAGPFDEVERVDYEEY